MNHSPLSLTSSFNKGIDLTNFAYSEPSHLFIQNVEVALSSIVPDESDQHQISPPYYVPRSYDNNTPAAVRDYSNLNPPFSIDSKISRSDAYILVVVLAERQDKYWMLVDMITMFEHTRFLFETDEEYKRRVRIYLASSLEELKDDFFVGMNPSQIVIVCHGSQDHLVTQSGTISYTEVDKVLHDIGPLYLRLTSVILHSCYSGRAFPNSTYFHYSNTFISSETPFHVVAFPQILRSYNPKFIAVIALTIAYFQHQIKPTITTHKLMNLMKQDFNFKVKSFRPNYYSKIVPNFMDEVLLTAMCVPTRKIYNDSFCMYSPTANLFISENHMWTPPKRGIHHSAITSLSTDDHVIVMNDFKDIDNLKRNEIDKPLKRNSISKYMYDYGKKISFDSLMKSWSGRFRADDLMNVYADDLMNDSIV